jgi:tetratricopeptide (TPR) repeat protein
MDPSQVDTLIQRLVVNPHDEQALATAHQSGAADPKSYAMLLERVGAQTSDPAYASHWLSEAANVWSTTLGDAHRAARVLMQAIERDPTQRTAADRLAQLYREKGDVKALVALLERRVKALTPLANEDGEIRAELTSIHEELGRLWNESLGQPRKGLDNFRRALELDPANTYALFGAREVYKALGEWQNALGLFESELAIETDPTRKLALLRDEAATRRAAGDLPGATRALGRARQLDAQDAGLQQEYGALIVDRLAAGEDVPTQEKTLGTELLVGLAEVYDGDHGLAYSAGALDIEPGHDRALQLYAHYARILQREEGVTSRYLAYIQANPSGPMAADARWLLAGSYESSGQLGEAIEVLEPLRTLGDPQAQAKLRELYTQSGQRMPSAAPPAPLPQPSIPKPRSAPAPAGRPGHLPSMSSAPAVPPPPPAGSLEAAQALVDEGKRDEALAAYRAILEQEPNQPEALSWVEDHLRTKRDYRALRDVLRSSVRAPGLSQEVRQERLREIAGLSEGNLRDVDGAIDAWKQLLTIDRSDEAARQALTRALEKNQRWDDLSLLLEYEASAQTDLEKKITLEKRLAVLHEQKRQDFVSAAEAWERIIVLIPDDDQAIATSSALFEKGSALDRAAQVIAGNATGVDDRAARNALYERLGQLRERLNDPGGAGEAYAEAAEHDRQARLWEAAERCFVAAQRWDRAGAAAVHRAEADGDRTRKAGHYARAAEHYGRGGNEAAFAENLAQATDLDPANEEFATALGELFTRSRRWEDLVAFLLKRSDRLTDRGRRVAVRREAAKIYGSEIRNKDAARETWAQVLEDGEDREALEQLIEDAVSREDYEEATGFLRRLEDVVEDRSEKARVALREAELVADGLGDVETAIARYERVLAELDPASRPALQAVADLQEARDNPAAAAGALEREMRLTASPADRGPIAERLARLYEQLGEPENAIRALDIVLAADPDDFDALARLCDLSEKTEQWGKLAELLAKRIEVEADNDEVVALTKKLGRVLADELDRGDEALAVFEELAQQGEAPIRDAYVELGDRLGWRGVVASKLVEWWFEAKPSPERTAHLRGAFERFADVGRDDDAVRVGCEVIRSKGGDAALAHQLERLAVKTNDLDALAVAHDFSSRELAGADRARELVRQAEVQLQAGAPRAECLRHGEEGLASIAPDQAEPLLARLAVVAEDPAEIVGLYERQIGRCKNPADRVNALARAAQIASIHDQIDRARSLFDLALGATPTEDALAVLERAARDADKQTKNDALRSTLCGAMANGGQGARDGGRTRGSLLRRAAFIAKAELHDADEAFDLLGDALVAHVEAASLDALEELARQAGDLRRAEGTLTRALGEVFEGPMVRQLLARRARLRRDELDDKTGAAADLKKLYDLSPTDPSALEELSQLLTQLGDHRAMVQLYEDQILRGKDVAARAELARRVARLWENELGDPREAADAWRRVLRMKPGDSEGTAGLEHAKANMLKKAALESESEPPPPVTPPSIVPPQTAALAGEPLKEALETLAAPAEETTPASHTDEHAPNEAQKAVSEAETVRGTATPETAHASMSSDSASVVRGPKLVEAELAPAPLPPLDLRDSERTAKANIVVPPMAIGDDDTAEHEPYDDEPADPKAITAVRTVDSLRHEKHDEASAADDEDDIDIPVDDTALADDVVIADDLAEMVEGDEASPAPAPAEKKAPTEPPPLVKRSVPPPLPRM